LDVVGRSPIDCLHDKLKQLRLGFRAEPEPESKKCPPKENYQIWGKTQPMGSVTHRVDLPSDQIDGPDKSEDEKKAKPHREEEIGKSEH
jgi:hypothetical protein